MSRSRPVAKARPATPAAAPRAPRVPSLRLACLLGMLCFLVYLTNLRAMGAWDSIPARLLPFSVLGEGNLNLDEFPWLRRLNPQPYFLYHTPAGHWFSRYSVGVPVLVTPLAVPVRWWLQHHHIEPDDVSFRLATVVFERLGAASIGALSVVLMCLALGTVTAPGFAGALTLVYGLGTSTWSIGSQALWQHGLAEVALAGLSWTLLGGRTRRHAVAAGGFAALAVFARPTMVVFALLALIFVWRERRALLPAFVSLPVAGAVLLVAYNARLASLVTGGYRALGFTTPRVERLAGLLVSPNRGLFIYTPLALLALPAFRLWRAPRDWLGYLPFGIAGYLLLYSAWFGWWGGYCYGPRFLTDALPAIVLCTVPTVERLWRLPAGRVAVALLAGWGIVVQMIGVYCDDKSWDVGPLNGGARAHREWDWSDLQIVRAAHAGWHGTELAPLLWQTLTDRQPAVLQPLTPAELVGEVDVHAALPLHAVRGRPLRLDVRVTNRSATAWPAFSDYGYLQCKLAYRWWVRDQLRPESGGTPLPRNLGPGESVQLSTTVDTPSSAGAYELELVVVQVLDVDKGLSGGATARVPVQVE